jgi:uncharacterized protein YjbJ (UPF0337 family)
MSDDQKKDLGKKGAEDTLKGKMKQVAGKFQSAFGRITGNREAEIKGGAKQVEGAAQVAKGKMERKAADALDRSETNE